MPVVLRMMAAVTLAGVAPPTTGDAGLVGSWTLVSAVAIGADGSPRPVAFVAGSNRATGRLDYSADGEVAVQIVGHPRPAAAVPGAAPSASDAIGLLRTYYAYYGRYTVDAARHVVTHHVVESLWPGENGADYARRYTIVGDQLTFDTEPLAVAGDTITNHLVWQRARD